MGANSYTGDIYVTFKVQNPDSNKDEGVFLEVELYYSEAMKYKISQIKEAYLMPSFECKYPCETCSPFDPFDCLTCPQGRNKLEFLQVDVDTGKRTCVSQCDPGFTYDFRAEKTCFPCDSSCETCRSGGNIDD